MFEVLSDPAYEPFWYVGLWFILCALLGVILGELSYSLLKKWKCKRSREEA